MTKDFSTEEITEDYTPPRATARVTLASAELQALVHDVIARQVRTTASGKGLSSYAPHAVSTLVQSCVFSLCAALMPLFDGER